MRLHRAAVVLAAGVLFLATPALAFELEANLTVGPRALTDDSIQQIDDQFFAGVDVGFGVGLNYLEIVAGFYASGDDTTQGSDTYQLDMYEFSAGVLVKDRYGMFRPFVGGGISAVVAKSDISLGSQDFNADDTVGGIYITGGAYWRFASHFNLGISARALVGADVDFDFAAPNALEQDVNYFQIGVLFGVSFGDPD